MFLLLLQLAISQTSPPLNVGVITALRPELGSLETECSENIPTITKAVSDAALYINSISTVCSFDKESYISPLMDYRSSYWNNAVENGGLSCNYVPPSICDEISACLLSSGECQNRILSTAEPCSRVPVEFGLQQFRTAIAMAEYLFNLGHNDLAQSILSETQSAISEVEIISENCPSGSTSTTTEIPIFVELSLPDGSGFRSVEEETVSDSESISNDGVQVCAPGSVASRNTWCWDEQYTCESCCNTDFTTGPIRRPCWTPSFTKASCCGNMY